MAPIPAVEVLLSPTRVNAEIFRLEDRIGTVSPADWADLIAIRGNPWKDLRVFQNTDHLAVIMKGGALYKQTL